jgi:Holliday junction resolvasome RuvABC endonuclease subunit
MDRSKITTVLTLDPAASTGYCVGRVEDGVFNIFEYGFIEIDVETDYIGDRCIELMDQVDELINKHAVDHVAIEDFFFNQRSAQGSDVNAAYRTAIHIKCRERYIGYTIVNISAWKKLVSGRTTSTREQKAKWGKEASKKLMIQEALWKNYGFKFPNHSISKKTGKPIKFRYDIVDAVAQAVYFVRQHLDVQKVQLSVTAPPDADFGKRKPRTLFNYSEAL